MSPLATALWNLTAELTREVKALKKFTWNNLGVILDLVSSLVQAVENGKLFTSLPGPQKKAIVLEVLEALIDMIDLKLVSWIPQSWVKTLFKKLLPLLIDWIVSQYNRIGFFKHTK